MVYTIWTRLLYTSLSNADSDSRQQVGGAYQHMRLTSPRDICRTSGQLHSKH